MGKEAGIVTLWRLVRRFGIRRGWSLWRIRAGVRSRAYLEEKGPEFRKDPDPRWTMPGYRRRKGKKGAKRD